MPHAASRSPFLEEVRQTRPHGASAERCAMIREGVRHAESLMAPAIIRRISVLTRADEWRRLPARCRLV